jgi:hypothetical protein
MPWTAPEIWEGGEAWIIGGGPSMPRQFDAPEDIIYKVMHRELPPEKYSRYLAPIHDKHVIAVNNAYQIGNWIDVVFFGDYPWYLIHRNRLAKFPGLKVSRNDRFFKKTPEGIKHLPIDTKHRSGLTTRKNRISWNRNSGMAAINLAVHFGAKRIILLGFDMCPDAKTKLTHWHGSHRKPGEQIPHQPFRGRLQKFNVIAQDAKGLGVEIINASPNSSITEFPKKTVKELLT